MIQLYTVLVIAHRDFLKFLRDPTRIIFSFVFPVLIIGAFGGTLDSNLGASLEFDFLTFTFTGVLVQTVFMSTAQGVISLIEDRENDFSQEMFVSPVSRYAIILGKLLGETLVALPQGAGILLLGFVLDAPLTLTRILWLIPIAIAVSFFGGAFGLLVLSNLSSQRAANQVFPFIILPQWLLAGVFSPIRVLPLPLDILSRLTPLRYAVDLARGVFYRGLPDYSQVVLQSPLINLALIAGLFIAFLITGTFLFVRREQNR
jgi:ABC-2 type transport system permease protein